MSTIQTIPQEIPQETPQTIKEMPIEEKSSKVMPLLELNLKSKKLTKKVVKELIERCGVMYNFDGKEALIRLNLEKEKPKKEKKEKLLLPFDGRKIEGCCNGIVKNHGLYTQCVKVVEGYCKVCEGQPYGNIDERVKVGLYEYKDPKGKVPKRYLEVLKKKKISVEEMQEKCKKAEITINEEHLVEVATKRGRPKGENKDSGEKKSKGRPKKEKKVVEISNEEDLFATLVAQAQGKSEEKALEVEKVIEEPKEVKKVKEPKEKKVKEPKEKKVKEPKEKKVKEPKEAKEKKTKGRPKKESKEVEISKPEEITEELVEEEEEEEEEEADVVTKIEYEGKKYYKSKKSGIIYDLEQDVVGKWNEETKKIDFEECEEEEDEE
jgi:hypothetical protein